MVKGNLTRRKLRLKTFQVILLQKVKFLVATSSSQNTTQLGIEKNVFLLVKVLIQVN